MEHVRVSELVIGDPTRRCARSPQRATGASRHPRRRRSWPSAWVAVPSRKVAVLRSSIRDQEPCDPHRAACAVGQSQQRCEEAGRLGDADVKTARRYARSALEDRRAALEDLDRG